MTVILPALKSNNLIFNILSFTDCIRAYIIMRSLNRKANSKVHLLTDFVVPHKISNNRYYFEELRKLAKIQTLQFPIIIDFKYSCEEFDSFFQIYNNA